MLHTRVQRHRAGGEDVPQDRSGGQPGSEACPRWQCAAACVWCDALPGSEGRSHRIRGGNELGVEDSLVDFLQPLADVVATDISSAVLRLLARRDAQRGGCSHCWYIHSQQLDHFLTLVFFLLGVLNSSFIFSQGLEGANILVPSFLYAIRRIFAKKNNELSQFAPADQVRMVWFISFFFISLLLSFVFVSFIIYRPA